MISVHFESDHDDAWFLSCLFLHYDLLGDTFTDQLKCVLVHNTAAKLFIGWDRGLSLLYQLHGVLLISKCNSKLGLIHKALTSPEAWILEISIRVRLFSAAFARKGKEVQHVVYLLVKDFKVNAACSWACVNWKRIFPKFERRGGAEIVLVFMNIQLNM